MIEFKNIAYKSKLSAPTPTNSYMIKTNKLPKIKRFISNLFVNFLHRWGALDLYFHEEKIGYFKDTPIKKKTVTEAILSYLNSIEKEYYLKDHSDYCFLMGEKLFKELTKEQFEYGYFKSMGSMVYKSNDVYYNDPYRGKEIFLVINPINKSYYILQSFCFY